MSYGNTNIITAAFSGKLGDHVVLKNYGGITVIAIMVSIQIYFPWIFGN